MKRILTALLLVIVLSLTLVTALADEAAQPEETLDYSEMSDIERLARGIVYIPETMTLKDFYETLKTVDESERYINSDKFVYFCYAIEDLYYIPTTAEEIFRQYAEKFKYVDTKDMDTAYKNLFSLLDKYSYYLPPQYYDSFWNSTTAKGVGITFVYDETGDAWGSVGTFVEGVAPGSTAAAMGIRTGDRLTSLMGYDVSSSPFTAVQAILSSLGEDDNYIELKYERIDGEEISETDVTLERRSTVFREFSFHLYPNDRAFVLQLSSFKNPNTYLQLIERFKELKELGYVNAILDLRDNSGGDVYVASNIISAFIEDEDVPLFSMGREGKLNYHGFKSNGGGVEFDTLHVLVNENTASSAEITALCLKQHAGATLVGKKTVGKAVAQSAATLIDDSTYGITTFVAYDYRGQTYNEKGLMPTVYLDNPRVKFEFPTDLEWFNYINYVEAVDGAENEVVTALERRLELMGFMRGEFVDGKWDEHTTNAVTFLQLSVGQEPTGALTLPLVNSITDIVNTYKDSYYTVDNQLNAVLGRIY